MSNSDEQINLDEPVKVESVQAEKIEREEKPKKCMLKDDVHLCLKCCTYSWAFSLNGCECCCGLFSDMCIGISKLALCCKAGLEYIDCDGH